MPLELLTIKDLQDFKRELFDELKKHFSKEDPPVKKLLKSREVRKLLRISPGSLQNLRNNGTLPYSQIGKIIYYHPEDLDKLQIKKRRGG